jgi:hypothetical protein
MNIPKISNEELNRIYRESLVTKDYLQLREAACFWVLSNAIKKFNLEEDDVSEIYLTFFSQFEKCFKGYQAKSYDCLPGYLSIYTKHIVLNLLKKGKRNYPENYFKLWNEDEKSDFENPLIPGITQGLIYDRLTALPPFGRILIFLRFNLPLEKYDQEVLSWYLKSIHLDYNEFHFNHEKKIFARNVKRQELITKINACNRKIFLSTGITSQKIYLRKKHLLHSLSSSYKLYSLRELSELLKMKIHKVNYYYDLSMQTLKFSLKSEEFLHWEENIAA